MCLESTLLDEFVLRDPLDSQPSISLNSSEALYICPSYYIYLSFLAFS